MKTIKSLALALLVIAGTAVSQAQNKKINVEKSNITWVGKKVTGEHSGTVKFKEGILVFQKGALKGGNFTVDMTTIGATDLTGDWKQKLDGHLKADDFFGANALTWQAEISGDSHPRCELAVLQNGIKKRPIAIGGFDKYLGLLTFA